ncbi:Fur family transcriptional regulator [Ottowia sp. VDI28]|uniref:Fur family transcriptional regulator n=1 Tax=Ottowia sp. VDI28 TaxID=3133968 RepID=UPI003C2E567F
MSAPILENTATPADLLGRAGLRRTRAALTVLDVLLAEPVCARTHAEFEKALMQRGVPVNRVTLYRLLERLVATEVLERHSDDADRAWRFGLRSLQPDMPLPRFECDACHRHFNLPEASEPTKAAADQILSALSNLGHMGQRIDLSIHGTCSGCIEPPSRR